MHPAYRSDRPGKAPDCGMDLEPVYAGGEPAQSAAMSPGSVHLTPDQEQAARLQTETVQAAPRHRTRAHRGPRGAGRSPDLSGFGRRRWMGAPRVLGPHRNPGEARRGSGGLLQQRHLRAAASLRLRAGILRTVKADPIASRRSAGPRHAATRHGARQPPVPRDGRGADRRTRPDPRARSSTSISPRPPMARSWSAMWPWASGS